MYSIIKWVFFGVCLLFYFVFFLDNSCDRFILWYVMKVYCIIIEVVGFFIKIGGI